jgi:hypothetical protein
MDAMWSCSVANNAALATGISSHTDRQRVGPRRELVEPRTPKARKDPNPVFASNSKIVFAAGFPRMQKAQGATWAIMNSIYSLLWNVKHPVEETFGRKISPPNPP